MKKYAVIGNPVSQSLSPFIHQQFAEQTGIKLSYEALTFDCPTKTRFEEALMQLCAEGYKGVNVTLPYKIFAFESLRKKHELSLRAEQSRAVNTITFVDQNRWLGDNTDGAGLVHDLKNNLDWSLKETTILLLGAGGAARGAISSLANEQPAFIHILNRDHLKAEQLVKIFAHDNCEIRHINPPLKLTYQLIINATSASLWQQLPVTISCLNVKTTCCYDMVYKKAPTMFLSWAKENGAKSARDGLGMLVEQAAESFYQWHNVMPYTSPVFQLLRPHL